MVVAAVVALAAQVTTVATTKSTNQMAGQLACGEFPPRTGISCGCTTRVDGAHLPEKSCARLQTRKRLLPGCTGADPTPITTTVVGCIDAILVAGCPAAGIPAQRRVA